MRGVCVGVAYGYLVRMRILLFVSLAVVGAGPARAEPEPSTSWPSVHTSPWRVDGRRNRVSPHNGRITTRSRRCSSESRRPTRSPIASGSRRGSASSTRRRAGHPPRGRAIRTSASELNRSSGGLRMASSSRRRVSAGHQGSRVDRGRDVPRRVRPGRPDLVRCCVSLLVISKLATPRGFSQPPRPACRCVLARRSPE
jgi:hypothetical protein